MSSVAGGITGQGSYPRLLQNGLNAIIGNYKQKELEYTALLDVAKSSKAYEEDTVVGGLGLAAVKPEGQGFGYGNYQQGWGTRYNHVIYAIGAIITFEAMENNLYKDQLIPIGRMLKRSLIHTEEQVAANLFNNGYDANFALGDGLSLFNSAHRKVKGGTFSNVLSTAADLSEAALEDVCIAVSKLTDDAGLLINAQVRSLHVPPDLEFIAQRILGSNLQPGTANNDTNALRSMSKVPQGFYVNHRFTDVNNWFVRTDVEKGGRFFRRSEHRFGMDNDFGTDNYRHKGMTWFSVGCSDARQYFGSGAVA